MKKKISGIITAALLVASLAGCGADTNVSSVSENVKETTVTETSTSAVTETSVSTEAPVVETSSRYDGKFVYNPSAYYIETSTELVNIVMGIFPVNDNTAVLQFKYYDAVKDEEMPIEETYAYTFTTEDGKVYTHESEDQTGAKVTITVTIDADGNANVSSDYEFNNDIRGKYLLIDGAAELDGWTMIEYLRNIPELNIGDFGLFNPYDDIVESTEGGWLHDLTLLREGLYYDRLLVADDFSVVFKADGEGYKLAAGSVENLLNYSEKYEIYNEEEDSYTEIENKLVGAVVMAGTGLYEGQNTEVCIYAPVELTENIKVTSSDTSVVSVDGANITAVAPGEAVLTVEYDYGGFNRTEEIPMYVFEYDAEMGNMENEYVDEKYTTYYDKVSQRAVLEICHEDDIWSVEILWSDSATTMHHWSYVGTDDGKGNLTLNGSYFIETLDEEYKDDEVIFENMGATLTLGADGCYYWHDEYEDAGKDCIFELPETD